MSDVILAQLQRLIDRASLADQWVFSLAESDAGRVIRVAAEDTGAALFDVVLPDDPERATDTTHDVALACTLRGVVPLLMAEVRRLRSEKDEAVAALDALLRKVHGEDAHARYLEAERQRQRLTVGVIHELRDGRGAEGGQER